MSLDLATIGKKLERCRTQLQLTFEEVEKDTGINVERIKTIERGSIEPSGDEILIFSDFYKQDYNFFISNQKLSASEQIDVLYRKFGEVFSKDDRWAIQEFLFLCESEQFIWEELKWEPKEFKFKPSGNYFKGHGEAAARSLRTHLGYNTKDLINDLYYDLRKIGLHIFRRKLKNSNISGLFVSHPYAGKCILVNYDEDIFRQNFTIAHEVGHSVFDFEKAINISFQNDLQNRNDLIEIRANTFASNFLIPKEAIKSFNISEWTEEILIRLAIQLKTNILPLLISLKEANLIGKDQFSLFSKLKVPLSNKEDTELKTSSEKIKNAKKLLLEKGLSTFYVHKCFEAYDKGIITERRFAEMLLTDEMGLPSIIEKFSLKLKYGN